MILYFADRKMNIIGHASTSLPNCIAITDDCKLEDIETGVNSFEADIQYGVNDRDTVQKCAKVGNYILRSNGKENEFYTIIDTEEDTKKRCINVYAEDAGLDLINEVVGPYKADKAYPISHYINKFSYDSGFEIGINEVSHLTRKLSWEGEATATERLASVATQFDGCEVFYSFEVKNLIVTKKIINIRKKRGKNDGAVLRLNAELDRIISKQSVANLATALNCVGGTPENSQTPVTLNGYKYDDGDFYVSGNILCSRKAKDIWSRYVWNKEPNKINGESGHIVKSYSYDTLSQQTLCNHAITKLKKLREIEVNYEVDIKRLPDNVCIGDTVNIVDEEGHQYIQTRILRLERSVCNKSYKAVLGDFLILKNDINRKVLELADKFSKESLTSKRALQIATNAKNTADQAKTQADASLTEANKALEQATNASGKVEQATASAAEATKKAEEASNAVSNVQSQVQSLETTVTNANLAAQNAHKAAETAKKDAETAKQQATEAITNANSAKDSAEQAHLKTNEAIAKAEDAVTTAGQAKTEAATASATANAAKLDADQAKKDIATFTQSLTTLENTMKADYARKTDLTETESKLQTSITQNAAGIATNAKQITIIDETANTAKATADAASKTASEAQSKADAASLEATAAQTAADQAKASATAAQTNADNAKLAAKNAESVANKAQTDLTNAKADLATVQGRVDATEQEISDAQAKVLAAQTAADKAKADAVAANKVATDAQTVANTASTNATAAQKAADDAAIKALNAQNLANQAKGDASTAQQKADQAASAASKAQSTADQAKTTAATAQAKANQAVLDANSAQTAADKAKEKADQAALDLSTAQKNLADVTNRVGATEQEVANAQAAVNTAQQAADKAKADALAAQTTADTAKANAAKAQSDATNAKTAADKAQTEATAAKKAADKAQADANALAVRVTSAETKITQNSEAIALAATKKEVTQTLGNYYTKKDTDAKIQVESNKISQSVTEKIDAVKIGGRNYALKTSKAFTIKGTGITNQTSEVYYMSIDWQDIKDKDVVISFDYHFSEDSVATTEANRKDIGGVGMHHSPWIRFARIPLPSSGLVGHVVGRAHISGNIASSKTIGSRVDGFTGSVTLSNFKLEFGNKATDWTPAPEDVQQDAHSYTDNSVDKAQSTVVEGYKTLIDQTSKDITAMVNKVKETTDGNSSSIASLSNQLQITSEMAQFVKTTTENLQQVVDGKVSASEIKEWARFDGATLELGASNQPFKCKLTTTELAFYQGTNKVAWISNNELNILTAIIAKSIGCGNFTFVDEGDLGFSLI